MVPTLPRRDEIGASSIEYGLIVVAIAALIVVILFLFGGVVQETFGDSCDEIHDEASTAATCAS